MEENMLGAMMLNLLPELCGTGWWVLILFVLILSWTFRRQILSAWNYITEKVLWLFKWIHFRNQLPEAETGPFGWTGGGKQTIELGEGEKLEFVREPPEIRLWLFRQPPANPNKVDHDGNRDRGMSPLILVPILIFLIVLMIVLVSYGFLWLFSFIEANLSSFVKACLFWPIVAQILMIPAYWIYEFNRRHTRWVQTSFIAYVISGRFGTRTLNRSPTPISEVLEPIQSSSLSASASFISRTFGGWLHELFDFGDLWIGSRFASSGDIFLVFPNITGASEFMKVLRGEIKAHEAILRNTYMFTQNIMMQGIADTAGVPTSVGFSAQVSALQQARQKAESVLAEWRKDHPSGESVNLLTDAIRNFTHPTVDLENGQRIEPPTP